MKTLQGSVRRFFESRVRIHLAFIILFVVTFCLPSIIVGLPLAKVPRVVVYALFLLLCIYSGRWCCKTWFLSNRYRHFLIYSLIITLVLIVAGILGLAALTNKSILAISLTVLFFVVLFFLLGSFLSITKTTISRQLNEASIAQQQKESELQLLKSQLSPHFLFNVLNNLYGLSLKRDDKVPGMILKLSSLLRYSLYDTVNHFVSLQNELSCIEDYVGLEKIRIGARLSLQMNLSKENIEGVFIAPMLLLVFVENAFKHSVDSKRKNVEIEINFRMVDEWVELSVKNTKPDDAKPAGGMNNSSGIGLSVTKKRLELLYSNKYSLHTSVEDCYYKTILKIKTR